MENKETSWGYTKTCACCGKEFFRLTLINYAYKYRPKDTSESYKYFCSYGCLNKYLNEIGIKKEKIKLGE